MRRNPVIYCLALAAIQATLATSDAAAQERVEWRLVAVDGHPVPEGANAVLQFLTPGTGRYGCGIASGDFAMADGRIVLRETFRLTSIRHPAPVVRLAEAARCDDLIHSNRVETDGDDLIVTRAPGWRDGFGPRYTFRRVQPAE